MTRRRSRPPGARERFERNFDSITILPRAACVRMTRYVLHRPLSNRGIKCSPAESRRSVLVGPFFFPPCLCGGRPPQQCRGGELSLGAVGESNLPTSCTCRLNDLAGSLRPSPRCDSRSDLDIASTHDAGSRLADESSPLVPQLCGAVDGRMDVGPYFCWRTTEQEVQSLEARRGKSCTSSRSIHKLL